MFICSPCLDASKIKTLSISRSYGPCEMCNKAAQCHDIHPLDYVGGHMKNVADQGKETQHRTKTAS